MCVNRWFPIGTLFFFLARQLQTKVLADKACFLGIHPKSSVAAAKNKCPHSGSGRELYRYAESMQAVNDYFVGVI